MKTKNILLSILISFSTVISVAQEKSLAEMLGYPRDSKLLIIHADDMGLAHSVNTATLKAFESGSITSGSIMVPCPWTLEICDYIREHPGLDAGVHLTLTAEWDNFKWDGVTPSDQIESLLDEKGYFYPSVEEFGKNAIPAEAIKEMSAQVEKLISMGVKPSHIDTHMGSVLAKPELILAYLQLSDKYKLPVLFPRAYTTWLPPELKDIYSKKIFLLDNLFMIDPQMIQGKWFDGYKKGIESMKPGLNQMIVHVAIDNDEMKAIAEGHDDYGSAWRQNDLDLVQSKEFRDLLKTNNIILISWGQIRDLMQEK
jgi:chitin disaccharide deacetylase